MTHPDDGRDVGRLLGTLVPDLPAPPDRLAAVGRRVRRRRLRAVALAAAAVAVLLLGGAIAVAARPSPDIAGDRRLPADAPCPATPPEFPYGDGALPSSAPGELAPPGAVRAVLCRYNPVPELQMTRPGPPRRVVLTTDVAGLVDALNTLPSGSGMDDCFLSGDGGGYLTLQYRNGRTTTVELSGPCSYARRGAITRHDAYQAIEAFDSRLIAQERAAARPAEVPPPGCAPQLTPSTFDGQYLPDPISDVWMYTHGPDPDYLTVPLAVITACRYTRADGDTWTRTRQVTDRDTARDTATALEATARTRSGEIPYLTCTGRPTTVDVLVLRDVTGETREVRATRDTCPVVTFDFDGAPPSAALDRILDDLLGRPS